MDEITSETPVSSLVLGGLDVNTLKAHLETMEAKRAEAQALADQAHADPETLGSFDDAFIKTTEQVLSKAYNEADESRKAFKREWEAPLKSVEAAYKTTLEDIKRTHQVYKSERIRRDNGWKKRRFEVLCDHYAETCANNGVATLPEAVDINQFFIDSWLNKSVGEVKAFKELDDIVLRILKDYTLLKSMQFHFPAEAERCFFRTLDLSQVKANDDQLKAEDERAAAVINEMAEVVAYRNGDTSQEPQEASYSEFERKSDPEPVQTQNVPEEAPSVPWVMIINGATVEQVREIGKFCGSMGVTGTFKQGTLAQVCVKEGIFSGGY